LIELELQYNSSETRKCSMCMFEMSASSMAVVMVWYDGRLLCMVKLVLVPPPHIWLDLLLWNFTVQKILEDQNNLDKNKSLLYIFVGRKNYCHQEYLNIHKSWIVCSVTNVMYSRNKNASITIPFISIKIWFSIYITCLKYVPLFCVNSVGNHEECSAFGLIEFFGK